MARNRPAISIRDVATVLRGRTILLLLVGDVGAIAQYTALTGWLPTFFNEIRNISLEEAGFLTSILPFVGVFAVFVGGALPIRFSFRAILVFSGILVTVGGFGSFLSPGIVAIYAFGRGSRDRVMDLRAIPCSPFPCACPGPLRSRWRLSGAPL